MKKTKKILSEQYIVHYRIKNQNTGFWERKEKSYNTEFKDEHEKVYKMFQEEFYGLETDLISIVYI